MNFLKENKRELPEQAGSDVDELHYRAALESSAHCLVSVCSTSSDVVFQQPCWKCWPRAVPHQASLCTAEKAGGVAGWLRAVGAASSAFCGQQAVSFSH